MKCIIRLGDPTDHGGKVESVTATWFTVDGIAVARVGDKCSCPVRGHDGCTIKEGNPNHIVGGLAVAYAGNTTTCGAVLEARNGNFGQT